MTAVDKIRVLLADDHSLFREGLCGILNALPDFEVVGEANDGLEVMVKARELRPDLIIMDVSMPGCNGVEATQRIKAESPEMSIVMLQTEGWGGSIGVIHSIRRGWVRLCSCSGFRPRLLQTLPVKENLKQ